jgi:hypothetical protein
MAIAALAATVLLTSGCAADNTATADRPAPKVSGPASVSAQAATGDKKAVKIPQTVKTGTFSYTITKVEDATTLKDDTGQVWTSTVGAFFEVTTTVKNLTGSAQPYDLYSDRIYNADGKPYNVSGFILDGKMISQNLPDYAPGQERALIVVFAVPTGFSVSKLFLGTKNWEDSTGAPVTLT